MPAANVYTKDSICISVDLRVLRLCLRLVPPPPPPPPKKKKKHSHTRWVRQFVENLNHHVDHKLVLNCTMIWSEIDQKERCCRISGQSEIVPRFYNTFLSSWVLMMHHW